MDLGFRQQDSDQLEGGKSVSIDLEGLDRAGHNNLKLVCSVDTMQTTGISHPEVSEIEVLIYA
jgi:hypothetical protein